MIVVHRFRRGLVLLTAVVMLLFAPIASMVPGFTSRARLDVELSAFMASKISRVW